MSIHEIAQLLLTTGAFLTGTAWMVMAYLGWKNGRSR